VVDLFEPVGITCRVEIFVFEAIAMLRIACAVTRKRNGSLSMIFVPLNLPDRSLHIEAVVAFSSPCP